MEERINFIEKKLLRFKQEMEWSDEIPSKVIHVSYKWTKKWKVRKNWWNWIIWQLWICIMWNNNKIIQDDVLIWKIKLFIQKFTNKDRLTTKEDIDQANALLLEVIWYFESELEKIKNETSLNLIKTLSSA